MKLALDHILSLFNLVGGHESLHGVGARGEKIFCRRVVLRPVGHGVTGGLAGIAASEDGNGHHNHARAWISEILVVDQDVFWCGHNGTYRSFHELDQAKFVYGG